MTAPLFLPLPTGAVRRLQNGGLDANGQPPERHISDGVGVPCRHCLQMVAAGDPYLILAYRPFPEPQPYAEQGPIFLHAEPCTAYADHLRMPPMFGEWERLLVRGSGPDNRIIYGTGRVVPVTDVADAAADILARPEIAYVHVRSASNNCYQCRIERG